MLRLCSKTPHVGSLMVAQVEKTALASRAVRQLTSSAVLHAEEEEGEASASRGRRWRSGKYMAISPSFEDWLEKEGTKFKNSTKPKNWIGGNVPFPLNPSFKPPTPLSDSLRTSIYTMHAADPASNNTRELSQKFGLSIKRVEAIIKLKTVEEEWKKGKPLQTAFRDGMENVLGIQEDVRTRKAARTANAVVDERMDEVNSRSRADVQAADMQNQEEGQQGVRDRGRYRRMYWESVSEAETPIVPHEVERARIEGKERRESQLQAKSNPVLLKGRIDTDHSAASERPAITRTHSGQAPGRPSITFINVGGKFMDIAKAQDQVKEGSTKRKH